MSEIVIVGLGEISKTHIQAIEQCSDKKVVAGVDTNPAQTLTFKGHELPVYATCSEALRQHAPDTFVVATSTPTHFKVCQEIFEATPQPLTLLLEKPCADSLVKVTALLNDAPANVVVYPLHHFAYHPEVLWAAGNMQNGISKFGEIVSYEAVFDDPKSGEQNAEKRRAHSSSWLDSGINALTSAQTMLNIASADMVDLHVEDEMTARMDFRVARIIGNIVTRWRAETPVFRTQIKFDSGAALQIDHLNVKADLVYKGERIDFFDNSSLPRRLSQYTNMYEDIFINKRTKFDKETTLRLYELLFSNESSRSYH